jgi:hypothetical protein
VEKKNIPKEKKTVQLSYSFKETFQNREKYLGDFI